MHRIVYVARHGETDWNRAGRWQGHTDVELCEAGRAQARLLAARLRDRGIVRVFASDLMRARETAEIVASVLGLPNVGVDPGLRERAFGCFEGLTREECAARFPDAWERYRADPRQMPPGAEGQEPVIARMRDAVRRVASADGPTLIISHGGSMRALIGTITGGPVAPMANTAVFRLLLLGEDFLEAEPLTE